MDRTKIDWAMSTWNPITGCYYKCPYCYARGIANRFAGRKGCRLIEPETYRIAAEDGTELIEINEQPYYLNDDTHERYKCAYPHGLTPTIHRYRMAEYIGRKKPRNIFVGSMADIFGAWVPDRWIREVFMACEAAPQHNYMFLTKNPRRYLELNHYGELPKGDNFWYGTSVTKTDDLFMFASEHRFFLSVEPILEDLGDMAKAACLPEWIIVGAETGKRKGRVMAEKPWVDDIVKQCRERNIPVFMKESLRALYGDNLLREFPKGLRHE